MAYLTSKLITEAYYLSGVVARELETVSGSQMSDALLWLNELISMKSIDNRLISFYKNINFNAVIGQEKYFIPDLLEVESVTFNIGVVRFSMTEWTRDRYFGSSRVDGIKTVLNTWHFERTTGGGDLYLYFEADQTYPMELWGKFALSSVTLFEDLSLSFEENYILYLKYDLAKYICEQFNLTFGSADKLEKFEKLLTDVSPMDFSMQKLSSFNQQTGDIYAQANLGRGWTP